MLLESKKSLNENSFKNKIGISLFIIGLISLVIMILLMSLWKEGGIIKEIISYIFDIAVTVTFWEALTILIVENKEKRKKDIEFIKRYKSINFHLSSK